MLQWWVPCHYSENTSLTLTSYFQDVFPDKATERKILSLTIRCPNYRCDPSGCNWTGELGEKEVKIKKKGRNKTKTAGLTTGQRSTNFVVGYFSPNPTVTINVSLCFSLIWTWWYKSNLYTPSKDLEDN